MVEGTVNGSSKRGRDGAPDRGQATDGFTLVEVLAVLLVLTLGIGAVIGVLGMANRYTGKTISRYTGMGTATGLLYDHAPLGCTADVGDADNDGWSQSGTPFSWTGSYVMTTQGYLNGFWCRRTETSNTSDIIVADRRWAWVEVDVYWGTGGAHVTRLQERIVRARAP